MTTRAIHILFALALTATIFVLDVLTPLAYGEWLLYAIPLLIAANVVPIASIAWLPAAGSLLTALGFFLSPHQNFEQKIAIVNRGMGIAMLWCLAYMTKRRREAQENLARSYRDLERRVEERTRELSEANEFLVREISERQRTERELQESEHKFKDLAENSRVGFYLMRDGVFCYANPFFAEIFGYSAGELVSRGYRELVLPEDLSRLDEHLQKRLEGDEQYGHYTFSGIRKDGVVLCLEAYNSRTIYQGSPAIIGAVVDITERRRAEEALRYSEARYRNLHDEIPTMIFTLDLTGTILSVNPYGASQLGYAIDELEGASVLEIFHREDRGSVAEQLRKCLREPGRVYHWQLRKIRKDGGLLWVEELAQAIYDLNGSPNVLVVCRDVTASREAEEALRKAHNELEQKVAERTKALAEANQKLLEMDRLKSMFIASMSHEIRTPLNSVIGFASILLNEWLGPVNAEQKENLAAILRAGKHLMSLLNDVIDLSRIESGKVEPLIEEFDIGTLVDEAVDLVAVEAREKGLELAVKAIRLTMRTDRRRLLQCLANLLTNAVKFTERGGVFITVSRCTEDAFPLSGPVPTPETVEISIEDTGIGIRPEDQAKLFQPFVRVVSPDVTAVSGTGLGLYLTARLVKEVLKGDVRCSSRYGRGSTFGIRIPVRIV
ncbi:PAS domain S-box protein [Geobacter sp. SVR]|uniref:PAS domain S-box protein n=1 Tax=Geobacter sp. SVR TaxID=2495594 RepID=UPI00143F02A2|nr:PAS domain S-box protein [Geobacter sp. SVR]BCS55496.1 hypothetical protein GSVR_38040 [Geobacter sp. SVR]GCF83499.1 sensor histidine kinase [Geobacter sp. SVR]